MLDVDAAIDDVLAREEPSVPVSPGAARAVAEILRRGGDLAVEALRPHAFSDPAIAAALLSAANVEGGAPVLTLPDAEARLGAAAFVRVVRDTAAGAAAAPGPLAELRLRAWRGAAVSAALCRELARERGLHPEEAYACGLLHDIGRLAAISALERIAAGARPAKPTPLCRWERIADRWHVALGTAFADRCRLPSTIRGAIASHHGDRARGVATTPMQRVVRSVDALVSVLVEGRDSEAAVDGADLTDAEAARLARAVERLKEHVSHLERPAPEPGGSGPTAAGPVLREPRGEGIRVRLAGREYAATGFARHQLIVYGPAPLGEGALLEVVVLDRRRGPFHARVLSSWEDGPRFGAILLPLGLSGPSLSELGGTLYTGAHA